MHAIDPKENEPMSAPSDTEPVRPADLLSPSTRPPTDSEGSGDPRVRALDPLPAPGEVLAEMPLGTARGDLVATSRREVRDVLTGEDDRLLVIVGPCSVHDPAAALEYATRLAAAARDLADDLVVVMRVYFEKPRTTVGWKGLINDPHLDGTHDVAHGLRLARQVLLGVLDAGVPAACEFLEPTSPQYIADAVTWGAIGARNAESQVHRQFASGLSMPVGFKNATDGDVQIAVDGCLTAAGEHTFFGTDTTGRAAAVRTTGNPDCHIILRGGRRGPNYHPHDVTTALRTARASGLHGSLTHGLVVDASHGNSGKDHERQAHVTRELAARLAAGEPGITGLMLESFLHAGAQKPGPLHTLTYGRSITDTCMDWTTTHHLLRTLAHAARQRRAAGRTSAPAPDSERRDDRDRVSLA
ncbi:3-deoxy-D-arabinoheptulosonate-7-phosphate synthase [Myceligenerans xiligouense]|uniref:3-deoxy-7-phosphoheptulonate synthase n=2 Tax=Myceligenerans xiligouense TaxID=253184 RepID=A0A3N4Z8K8_9MICO|nr:3-deoxy-D-arabinoheptulosonate-7-phosphate synthase [Myceligenerans xiligouense]